MLTSFSPFEDHFHSVSSTQTVTMLQDHLTILSQNIFDQVRSGVGLKDCTILSNIPLQLQGASFISIDPTSSDTDLTKMANFIHQTTWCLVAIIHLGFGGRFPIGNIRTLIERNVHSHVYFIGKSSTIDLEKWNRHAIVVERANEVNQSHVSVFHGLPKKLLFSMYLMCSVHSFSYPSQRISELQYTCTLKPPGYFRKC